jgi:hypothetical protein
MANATNTPTEAEFNKANDEFLQTLAPYLSSSPSAAQSQNEYPPDTKGDWDEVSGKFVPNPEGGTTYGQINPQTSGNVSNMKDWSFDQTSGQWTRTDPVTGETTVYDYKTPITGKAMTGADIENKADAGPSSSSQKNTQTPNKTNTPTSGPNAGTPTASTPSAPSAPTVTRFGVDPLEILKMGGNNVAHVNPLEELFGGSIYDHTPASSAHKQTSPEEDIVKALEGTQDYSSGGDVHALLRLLRS